MDWEVELAIVIGKTAKNVPVSASLLINVKASKQLLVFSALSTA